VSSPRWIEILNIARYFGEIDSLGNILIHPVAEEKKEVVIHTLKSAEAFVEKTLNPDCINTRVYPKRNRHAHAPMQHVPSHP
jgi:hypothetical protein